MARTSWRRRAGRALWKRAREVADAVALPEPFEAETFVARLAAERGRPIELMSVTAPEGAPCGLLMSTERADYILCPTTTTALHRQHILLHEVGHLLCGHTGADGRVDGVALDAAAGRQLMPSLSPELVRRVLGRTTYTEVEEREAELVASLLAQRVVRPEEPREPAPGVPDGVRRFDSLFGRRTP